MGRTRDCRFILVPLLVGWFAVLFSVHLYLLLDMTDSQLDLLLRVVVVVVGNKFGFTDGLFVLLLLK